MKYNLESYREFDDIIADDDGVLESCLSYRGELFYNIPISFLGIQNESLIKEALQYDLVAGVREVESIEDNIQFIKKNRSNVDRIVFVDSSYNDICDRAFQRTRLVFGLNLSSYNDICDRAMEKYDKLQYEIIRTSEIYIDELKNQLSKLGIRDEIIELYPMNFRGGEKLSYNQVNDIIAKNAPNTAVYSSLSYSIGDNSIGGKVIDHFNQGKNAGEIDLELLEDKNHEEICMLGDNASEYIFNYNILKKFEINRGMLPKDSRIIGDPLKLINEYKYIFINALIGIVGLIVIVVILITYIQHKKKYEEKLLKAMKKSEEANILKTHFISNISHELKTPINVILSAMHLVESNIENGNNDNNKNFSVVKENCYRLTRLLNNIIDVEKAETNDINLELRNVNIVSLIEELVLSIVPYAENRGLEVVFDTNEEDVVMAIDVNKIERIILNLVSNAIKFSNNNGEIYIILKFTEELLEISIEDNGIGISNKDIDKIFDRFIQLDNTLCRKNEGSGIGLSIVKAFVDLHKGNIYVCSKKDKGSRFVVEIPRKVINETYDFKLEENKDIIIKNAKIELSDIYD